MKTPPFISKSWPPARKKPGTGRRAIAASRLARRIAKLEQEVLEMAPVVVVFDRDNGIGSIPENLKRYEEKVVPEHNGVCPAVAFGKGG